MQTIPFSEARAQLADVLRGVESGDEPLMISRRGQASGVLMSVAQYQQLSGESQGFADRLQAWRSNWLEAAMATDDTDPFAEIRQTDAGRDFRW